MPGLFVNEGDEIRTTVVVGEDEAGRVFADLSKESLKESFDTLVEDSIKEYCIVFQRPSYGDLVENTSPIISQEELRSRFDPEIAQLERMIKFIKSWDLIDGEGNAVEVNKESIRKLHPLVARVAAIQFDAEVGVQ